jgi:hypothetical protein
MRTPVLASGIWVVALPPALAGAAAASLIPELPQIARLEPGNSADLEVQVLGPSLGDPAAATVTGGSLEGHFAPCRARGSHVDAAALWFRLPAVPRERSGRNSVQLAAAFAA